MVGQAAHSSSDAHDRALAFIEARLFGPLSVGEIAAECGLSAYHFSRLFSARRGESVMAYVRQRRLDIAAARLAREPEMRLIDLAFDCGFESQEAFTRAFAKAFGQPPGRYRRDVASAADDRERTPFMTVSLELAQSLERRDAFLVAGVSGRFDDATKAQIPALWDRFIPLEDFQGRIGGETYGLCWSPDAKDGSFSYLAGAAIAPGRPTPEGLEVAAVPAATYFVFTQTLHAGPLHPQMQAAVKEIWSERLPRSGRRLAGTPDFELYPPGFAPGKDGAEIRYYVPVAE
jgi:AraC family transcriptional regulator